MNPKLTKLLIEAEKTLARLEAGEAIEIGAEVRILVLKAYDLGINDGYEQRHT